MHSLHYVGGGGGGGGGGLSIVGPSVCYEWICNIIQCGIQLMYAAFELY